MSSDVAHEVEFESSFEAAPVVAIAIGLQVVLAVTSQTQDWTTWSFPWWIWLLPALPETAMFVIYAWRRPHRRLVQMGIRREAGIALAALASAATGVPPPVGSAFVGEISLTGLVRPAPAIAQRVAAARTAGCTTVFAPTGAACDGSDGVQIVGVRDVREALGWSLSAVETVPERRSA